MDLLTVLNGTILNKTKDDQSIRLQFLLRNSFDLWSLTVRLLQRPLLSPLAIAAHSRLGRLIIQTAITPANAGVGVRHRKALNFAAWSIRALAPPRVYLQECPPGSCFHFTSFADERIISAENANWQAICKLSSLKEQSEVVTEVLRTDVSFMRLNAILLMIVYIYSSLGQNQNSFWRYCYLCGHTHI